MRPEKDNKPSAFILFVHEWRKLRSASLSWELCVHLAGPAWKNMTLEHRQPYIHKARQLQTNVTGNEFNISNEPIDVVDPELEVSYVQQQIEKLVRNSVERQELETCNYYFVMVNYFAKDIFAPGELAAAQFSLREGVQQVYHTLINPDSAEYGSLLEAQEHSSATHQLPLPPNALGNQDLGAVYAALMDFVRTEPVFTLQDNLPIVSRALRFINGGEPSQLKVYPIEYLFYTMKRAACQVASLPLPESEHITNAEFKLDPHELLAEISCESHQQRNIPNHCAKSLVIRWGFKFAENLCSDLDIVLRPSRHMPKKSDCPSNDNEEALNETLVKVNPLIGEDQFNPDVLDALNSLDLDNIFDEEDFLDSDTDDDCNEDVQVENIPEDSEISSNVEASLDVEIDKIPLPPTPSFIVDISDKSHSDAKTNGDMKSVETYLKIMKSIEHDNQRKSNSPKEICSSKRFEPRRPPKSSEEWDSSENSHRTRCGPPSVVRKNPGRSRSRSRSRDNRWSIKSSSNRNVSPRRRFGFHKDSHDRSITPKRTRRDNARLRRSPSETSVIRSRETMSRINHFSSPRRFQKECVSPKGSRTRFRHSPSNSPIRRSRERMSNMKPLTSQSYFRNERSCRSRSNSPIWISSERLSRIYPSNSPGRSQKDSFPPNKTRRDHARLRRSPSYYTIRRSRERVSLINPSSSPRRFQNESVSPKGSRTTCRRTPPSSPIRRAREQMSPIRPSNSSRRFQKERLYRSPSNSPIRKSRERVSRINPSNSPNASPRGTRIDHWRFRCIPSISPIRGSRERVSRVKHSNSPRPYQKEWFCRSRSNSQIRRSKEKLSRINPSISPKRSPEGSRKDHTRLRRSPPYCTIRTSKERVLRVNPSKSPRHSLKENDLPHRTGRDNSRFRCSRSYSPIRRPRERVSRINPSSPARRSPYYERITCSPEIPERSNGKCLSGSIYTRDRSLLYNIGETTEMKLMSTPNILLPNDTIGESHPQLIGNRKSISTIITESSGRAKKLKESPVSIPALISPTAHHYKSNKTYKDGYYPTTYKHNVHDPPVLKPYDLRHRLALSRSNYYSPTALRHQIQEREVFLPQSQMVSYSQEQFPDYKNYGPAWEGYHLSQWPTYGDSYY